MRRALHTIDRKIKKKERGCMQQKNVIHETLLFGIFLAAAAGGIDAYTYLLHGEVFAGLQTGNFILLGIHLGQLQFSTLIHYLVPIFSFAAGSFLTRWVQTKFKEKTLHNQHQILILICEILLLLIVGMFSPMLPDLFANALLSLAASAQLQEFQRLNSKPFTSLMMTGNLRNLATNYFDGYRKHDPKQKAAFYETLTIIISFVVGAALSGLLAKVLGERTIFCPMLLLLIPLALLLMDTKVKTRRSKGFGQNI